MTAIVSVVNLTSLRWVIRQSVGLRLTAKSVVRANEAMAAARYLHSAIKTEWIFQKIRLYLE